MYYDVYYLVLNKFVGFCERYLNRSIFWISFIKIIVVFMYVCYKCDLYMKIKVYLVLLLIVLLICFFLK